MRFAKIENNILVAMFMASFADVGLCNAHGDTVELPPVNNNKLGPTRPEVPVYLRYTVRGTGLQMSQK